MSGNNRLIWCLAGAAGVLLLVSLVLPSSAVERYKRKKRPKKTCWTECVDGWVPRPPGALALSPQQLTPWTYCQQKCAPLPLVQQDVTPGHKRPSCPKGWRAVYNQNTAEWGCTDAPVNHSPF